MCGRFSATFDLRETRIRWLIHHDFSLFARRFNIAPSQRIAVIVNDAGLRQVKLMHWGLVPNWANDQAPGKRLINARAETLTAKASFSGLVDTRRCLIPADGFYEWRKEGKRKVPMWFYLNGKNPFAFAGLWDRWREPDGGNLETFTIVTTAANDLVRPVHGRMPVILPVEDEEKWLDSTSVGFTRAASVLKPYPPEQMGAHDVSLAVSKPEFDCPQCIQPVSDSDRLPIGQLSLL